MTVLRPASALLVLLAACSGTKETTTPTFEPVPGDDDDAGPDTADSAAPAPEAKLTSEVRFVAFIAWDANEGEAVSPIIDGNPDYISAYVVDLYETGWTDADEESYCRVSVDLAGTTLSINAVAEGYPWGIDVPSGLEGKSVGSDCLEKGFDPVNFAVDGDPIATWGAIDWQLRFGGTLSADLVDWLTPDPTTADFDITYYAAGAWSTENGGFETEDDSNFWYAYAMDDAHNVDFYTLLHDYEMVDAEGQPVTAYYVFDQRVYWNIDPTATE